ncbi:hypothetical protein HK405_013571, partial [Cladochytrium tenue]
TTDTPHQSPTRPSFTLQRPRTPSVTSASAAAASPRQVAAPVVDDINGGSDTISVSGSAAKVTSGATAAVTASDTLSVCGSVASAAATAAAAAADALVREAARGGRRPEAFFEFVVEPRAGDASADVMRTLVASLRDYQPPRHVVIDVYNACDVPDHEIRRLFGVPVTEYIPFKKRGPCFENMGLEDPAFKTPALEPQIPYEATEADTLRALNSAVKEFFHTEERHLKILRAYKEFREACKARGESVVADSRATAGGTSDFSINTFFPLPEGVVESIEGVLESQKRCKEVEGDVDLYKQFFYRLAEHVKNIETNTVKYVEAYHVACKEVAKVKRDVLLDCEVAVEQTLGSAAVSFEAIQKAPFQRFYAYSALFASLQAKVSPAHPVWPACTAAAAAVKHVLERVEADVNEKKLLALMLRIQDAIIDSGKSEYAFASHSQNYLADWDGLAVDGKSADRALFLLSDFLLELRAEPDARRPRTTSYKLVQTFPLANISARPGSKSN